MASPKIKATYSLDVETVRALERTARRWNVSKSEALRRVIRAAEERESIAEDDPLTALDALQNAVSLDPHQAAAWEGAAARERRVASASREQPGP